MSQYVNLTMRTEVFDEIIDDLMSYSTSLDNYYDIESCIHLIDFLHNEYNHDMNRQNKEFIDWREYEKLFDEYFDDGEFNENEEYDYMNFNKVNRIIEDYKEAGTLDVLDIKQQFFLILDIINSFKKLEV